MYELLTKTFMGVITGYITNFFAVKMLFKQYGPFGGVLLKTKDDFIANISAFVEREIINQQSLEQELEREEFRKILEKIVVDLVQKHLYLNTSEDILLRDIPGMEESFSNLLSYYKQNQEEFLSKIINPCWENINLEFLISQEQLANISAQIWESNWQLLHESKIVQQFITELYQEHGEKEIAFFLNSAILKDIAENLREETNNFHLQLEAKWEQEIDEVLEFLSAELGVEDICQKLEEHIKSQSLAQLLGREKAEVLVKELLFRIANYLKSPEGQELQLKAIRNFLELFKGIDWPLLAILKQDAASKLEESIQQQVPGLIAKALEWLKDNKEEIEDLLEESLNAVLEQGSGFKNILKKGIKDIFLDHWPRNLSIVERLVTRFEDKTELDQLSNNITKILISYLEKVSLGELIHYLELKELLVPEKLLKWLEVGLDKIITQMDTAVAEEVLKTELGAIFNFNFNSYWVKNRLIQEIKTGFIFQAGLTAVLQQEISRRSRELNYLTLKDLISKDDLEAANNRLLEILTAQKQFLEAKISQLSYDYIQGKKAADLFSAAFKEQLIRIVGENSGNYFLRIWPEISSRKLTAMYEQLNQQQLITSSTDFLLKMLKQNFSSIIEGRIQEAIASNLHRFSDRQVQEVVENFMGKELKPITRLGALLGGAAGFGLFFAQSNLHLPLSQEASFFTSTFTYGLVGWLTNVLALKMIFQPYAEKRVLGIKIPFTPGIVARNKENFACSMGKFIDQELLNPEAIKQIFQEKSSKFKKDFKASLSANNYQILTTTLDKNSRLLTAKISQGALAYLIKNQGELAAAATRHLLSVKLAEQDLSPLKKGIKAQGKNLIPAVENYILAELRKLIKEDKNLGQALPTFLKWKIDDSLAKIIAHWFQEMQDLLNDAEKTKEFLASYSPKFTTLLEKSVSEFITPSMKKEGLERAWEFILHKSKGQKSAEALAAFLEDKLAPEKELGSLLGGILAEFSQNMDQVLDFILRKALEFLQREREKIKDIVQVLVEEYLEGQIFWYLGFNFLDMDETIREVVDDLLDLRLPAYLQRKQGELKELAVNFLRKLESRKLGELGIDFKQTDWARVLEQVFTQQLAEEKLLPIMEELLDPFLEIKLKSLLQMASIANIDDVLLLFRDEIELGRFSLAKGLASQKEAIARKVLSLTKKIVEESLLAVPISRLSKGIKEEDIISSLNNILQELISSRALASNVDRYLDKLEEAIKAKDLGEILAEEYLERDLAFIFNLSTFQEALVKTVAEETEKLLENLNYLLDPQLKDYLLDILLESTVDSLQDNFLDLMSSVNIRELTQAEINKMDPAEIEALFNSFASHYFTKLKAYGCLGGGFGFLAEFLKLLIKTTS